MLYLFGSATTTGHIQIVLVKDVEVKCVSVISISVTFRNIDISMQINVFEGVGVGHRNADLA